MLPERPEAHRTVYR